MSGNARVCGSARIYDKAIICDNASIYGDARISNNAQIFGNARVHNNAEVSKYTDKFFEEFSLRDWVAWNSESGFELFYEDSKTIKKIKIKNGK